MAVNGQIYRCLFKNDADTHFAARLKATICQLLKKNLKALKGKNYHYVSEACAEEQVVDTLFVQYMANATIGVITWWLENDMMYSPKYVSRIFYELTTKNVFDLYQLTSDGYAKLKQDFRTSPDKKTEADVRLENK